MRSVKTEQSHPTPEAEPFSAPDVRGYLHRPDAADGRGMVLTHGAGSDCCAPLLVAVAAAFAARGIIVLRCDLAFRQRRAKGPPSPASASLDRAGLVRALEALRPQAPRGLVLAGHSYGGRQGSMLAADESALAQALLLLSYPLHPPQKPAQLRTEHFPRLRVPAVFLHGTADPFATQAELDRAISLIPARTRILAVENAGHDLRRGRFDLAPVIDATSAMLDI